ncbi:MAG: acyltransferase [Vicinamibacterales bacterium]|nr:acyltransferase [Vicinamibacterales bacterium]
MQSPQRLLSIDALRGAAAIGVVLYHTNAIPGVDRSLLWGDALDSLMFLGKWGVWLFFVISGFCIHMQWVRAQVVPGARPLEFGDFWRRRIRRLYPPYLVTLVFYVWIRFADGSLQWDGLSAWKIFLHLFMLQNLDPQALAAMNNVYWTLAVEEQLYLLYFAFLAVRQRWGWGAALGLAAGARLGWFVLAFALNRAFDIQIVVTQAAMAQWVVWVLGALSVEAAWGLVRLPAAARNISIGGVIMGVASLLVWAQNYWLGPGLLNDVIWLTADVVWGAGFFVLVNWAVTREQQAAGAVLPRSVLWLAGVGLFSYSLYLTHEIVEWRLWPPVAESLVASGYALPHIVVASGLLAACLLFGWVFFQFFEKPFLSRSRIAVSGLASAVAR